jgi:translation initiation factor 2B subunit (eIF-2B alpha/beta/delta family)
MRTLIDSIVEEIRADRTTGAGELAKKGAEAIAFFISTSPGDAPAFLNELIGLARKLIDCQPSMASFFHLANIVLLAAEDKKDLNEMKRATKEAIDSFLLHLRTAVRKISEIGRGLIPRGAKVLTHSYSATVLRTLVDAKKSGQPFEVVCTESRPMCEGFQMARELSELGVKVQLQIDAAAAYTMKDATLVLVGADCLTPLGLVNKVGTYSLALSAKEKGVPCYALCGTEKLLGAKMVERFRILKKDPREVWPHPASGVEVLNFYFDTTPLDFLAAIVTEEGMIPGSEIFLRFQKMRVSKYFPT